jgi:hypothetical protein
MRREASEEALVESKKPFLPCRALPEEEKRFLLSTEKLLKPPDPLLSQA